MLLTVQAGWIYWQIVAEGSVSNTPWRAGAGHAVKPVLIGSKTLLVRSFSVTPFFLPRHFLPKPSHDHAGTRAVRARYASSQAGLAAVITHELTDLQHAVA